jgi:hypothetical protein
VSGTFFHGTLPAMKHHCRKCSLWGPTAHAFVIEEWSRFGTFVAPKDRTRQFY